MSFRSCLSVGCLSLGQPARKSVSQEQQRDEAAVAVDAACPSGLLGDGTATATAAADARTAATAGAAPPAGLHDADLDKLNILLGPVEETQATVDAVTVLPGKARGLEAQEPRERPKLEGHKKVLLRARKSNFASQVLVGREEDEEERQAQARGEGERGRGLAPTLATSKGNTAATASEKRRSGVSEIFAFLRTFDVNLYNKVGFFECLERLQEGDVVLFHTRRLASKLQRTFVHSGGFDHIGVVVVFEDCSDESCCPPELKQARRTAGVAAWHTLEADANGVSLYRFTPTCLGAYKGTVCIRHLELDPCLFDREQVGRELRAFALAMHGRPYEKSMMQMIRAANIFGANEEEDLSSVFCSELVAAAYMAMGLMDKDAMRPSNAYIPGDFASKNDRSRRAVRLVVGARLEKEVVIDCSNMRQPSQTSSAPLLQTSSLGSTKGSHNRDPFGNGFRGSTDSMNRLANSKRLREFKPRDGSSMSAKSAVEHTSESEQDVKSMPPRAATTAVPFASAGVAAAPPNMLLKRRSKSTNVDSFQRFVVKDRLQLKRSQFKRQSSVMPHAHPLSMADLRSGEGSLASLRKTVQPGPRKSRTAPLRSSGGVQSARLAGGSRSESPPRATREVDLAIVGGAAVADDDDCGGGGGGSSGGAEIHAGGRSGDDAGGLAVADRSDGDEGDDDDSADDNNDDDDDDRRSSSTGVGDSDSDSEAKGEGDNENEDGGDSAGVGGFGNWKLQTAAVRETAGLQLDDRHIQFVYVRGPSELHVSFDVLSDMFLPGEDGEPVRGGGSDHRVDAELSFHVIGPIEAAVLDEFRAVRGECDALCDEVLDRVIASTPSLRASEAARPGAKVTETVALPAEGSYQLRWQCDKAVDELAIIKVVYQCRIERSAGGPA